MQQDQGSMPESFQATKLKLINIQDSRQERQWFQVKHHSQHNMLEPAHADIFVAVACLWQRQATVGAMSVLLVEDFLA